MYRKHDLKRLKKEELLKLCSNKFNKNHRKKELIDIISSTSDVSLSCSNVNSDNFHFTQFPYLPALFDVHFFFPFTFIVKNFRSSLKTSGCL